MMCLGFLLLNYVAFFRILLYNLWQEARRVWYIWPQSL